MINPRILPGSCACFLPLRGLWKCTIVFEIRPRRLGGGKLRFRELFGDVRRTYPFWEG
jgi:hypothetical protein